MDKLVSVMNVISILFVYILSSLVLVEGWDRWSNSPLDFRDHKKWSQNAFKIHFITLLAVKKWIPKNHPKLIDLLIPLSYLKRLNFQLPVSACSDEFRAALDWDVFAKGPTQLYCFSSSVFLCVWSVTDTQNNCWASFS